MYYVYKNECCTNKNVAVAFKSKKEANDYMKINDGTWNTDMNYCTTQKALPYYIKKISGDLYKELS